MTHRPDIDGLRTIAVAAVIVFHLDEAWLPGGLLGVDVFFVISGFLITGIIDRQLRAGTFSPVRFWTRRIRRLVPALLVVTGATVFAGAFLAVPPDRAGLAGQALAAVFSFENILLWRTTTGYWSGASDSIPFLHAWSLSLEEQFYLVLPVILILTHRFAGGRVRAVLGVIAVASLLLCVLATGPYRNAAFYLLPARMWELLIGGLLALTPRPERGEGATPRTWGGPAAAQFLGLAMIVASLILVRNDDRYPGVMPLAACVGTAMLLRWGDAPGPVHRVLAWAPITYLGRLSYSLYLWHWPIIVYLGAVNPEPQPWLAVGLTFVASVFTHHVIEQPFRERFGRRPRRLAALAIPAAACFAPLLWLPFPPGLDALRDLASVPAQSRGEAFEAATILRAGGIGVAVPDADGPIDVCVVGSSHARVLCPPIAAACREADLRFVSMAVTAAGITVRGPTYGAADAEALAIARMNLITQLRPRLVIIAGRWDGEIDGPDFDRGMTEVLAAAAAVAERVVVLGQVPAIELPLRYEGALARYLGARAFAGESLALEATDATAAANARVAALVAAMGDARVRYHDPGPSLLDADGRVLVVQDGLVRYGDDDHVNDRGAAVVFEDALRAEIAALR